MRPAVGEELWGNEQCNEIIQHWKLSQHTHTRTHARTLRTFGVGEAETLLSERTLVLEGEAWGFLLR